MVRAIAFAAMILGAFVLPPAQASPAQSVYGAAYHAYLAGLAAQCPAKRLDWIAPGETPDHNDDFEQTLSKRTVARIDRIAPSLPGGGDARCPGIGASCGNATRLAAYRRAGVLPRFVRFMCALPERCTEQSTCTATR